MRVGEKMKKFIKIILTLFFLMVIVFFGKKFYDEISKTNVSSEVEEFVSNITISSGETNKKEIQTPQVLETTVETISPSDENIEYSNSSNINKYFYNQLDNNSKIIYNALEKNKENMKTGTFEINLGTEFSKLLSTDDGQNTLKSCYQTAVEAYTYDNPEIFYIDFQKLYLNIETTTRGYNKTYKVLINSGNNETYLLNDFTKEKVDSTIIEIEKVKEYFVQNKNQNTYQNIKNIHDYLVETIDYDQTISRQNTYNLYGALVEKNCVCEGYAKAFKYLADALNIPAVIVSGTGTNSEGNTENHAWNYVQINEKWYAVDCTWDDPILIGGAILTNSTKYKYFLKGSNEFDKSHTPNGQFTENGKIFSYSQVCIENYK